MDFKHFFQSDAFNTATGFLSDFVPGGKFISNVIKPSGFDNLMSDIGLGSLLGQTSKADFLADGQKKSAILFQKYLPLDSNNAQNQINELLYHLQFLEYHYSRNLKNSSSQRAIDGNKESLKDVNQYIQTFIKNLPDLGYRITKNTRLKTTLASSNNVLNWFSDISPEVSIIQLEVRKSTSNPKSSTMNFTSENEERTIDKKGTNDNTLIYVGLSVLFFWKQIKKMLNIKTRRTSW
jgi:hypothetical protein